MMKILFLHGFFASGQCVPAMALQEAFGDKAKVMSPDLPLHPKEAISFIQTAIDSEIQERMVIYRAMYGEQKFWARSERMFLEKITRDGKTFNRFTEIDNCL